MSESKKFEELFLSECQSENLAISELNILLISDLHKNYSFLEMLKEWHTKQKKVFDYIFLTGDILTLNYPENNHTECIAKSEAEISSIISFLENMCLNVIYIGGNHDPKTLFSDPNQSLTIKSMNIHQKFHKICNDLYIFGLGGAVPTIRSQNVIYSEEFSPFVDIDKNSITDVVWRGYPYQNNYDRPDYNLSDAIYTKELNESFDKARTNIKNENTTENIKFILLTHNGPFYSQSSIMEYKDKCVYMGSIGLSKFLKKYKGEILLNIHGHTHKGKGLYVLGDANVINPGALTLGCFSLITLKRDCNDDWFLYSTEFIDLSS